MSELPKEQLLGAISQALESRRLGSASTCAKAIIDLNNELGALREVFATERKNHLATQAKLAEGFAAGQIDMRERAAKIADGYQSANSQIGPLYNAGMIQGAIWTANRIRMLEPKEQDQP